VDESLEYINRHFGSISQRTLFRRKRKIESEEKTMEWFSDFGRIRFVELHKKVCLDLEMILDDSLHRLYEEKQKPPKERDDHLILLLKKDIRAGCMDLSEMSCGTPIIAEVKWKLDKRAQAQARAQLQNSNSPTSSPVPTGGDIYPYYRDLLHEEC